MKITILISLILFICININAQTTNLPNTQKDSISFFAAKLTGKWKLTGYYKNGNFKETEVSTQFKNNGGKVVKTITDSGLIDKIYVNDSLKLIAASKEIIVIEMSFTNDGKGYYDYFNDYVIGRNWQSFSTCQPHPKIIHKNGKYMIHFSEMMGEHTKEFKLENDILIFKEKENLYVHYQKIND